MATAVHTLVEIVERHRSEQTSHPAVVITLNPEMVMLARRSPAFSAVVDSATLVVPDGIGLVRALRRRGHPEAERVGGADLVNAYLPRGEPPSATGSPSSAERRVSRQRQGSGWSWRTRAADRRRQATDVQARRLPRRSRRRSRRWSWPPSAAAARSCSWTATSDQSALQRGSASADRSTSSPAASGAHRRPCAVWVSNGPGGSRSSPGGSAPPGGASRVLVARAS